MLRTTLLALVFLSQIFIFQQKGEAHSYSIAVVTEDKVYVNPESVRVTKQGLAIETYPQHFVSIPAIFSDGQGMYLPMVSMTSSSQIVLAFCTRCQKWKEVYRPSKRCPDCGEVIIFIDYDQMIRSSSQSNGFAMR